MTEQLTSLTTRQKIGQLFFIGISGTEIDEATGGLLTDIQPGGVCLFARNIKEAGQTRALLESINEILPVSPFLSLDQEGGAVDRLRRFITPLVAAGAVKTREQAAEMGGLVGEIISTLGFNMDFAPVVDVVTGARAGSSNGLFSRPFGNSKEQVAELAGAFLNSLQSQDVIGCLKHFPGLGGARVDSHEMLPTVEITDDELSDCDLFPYRQLFATGRVHAVMAAHAAFPLSDLQERAQNGKLLPSSLSHNFLIHLLREQMLFGGVVITDDLEMGAIVNDFGIGDASVRAITAGADMVAICAGAENIREALTFVGKAVEDGVISEQRIDDSLSRIGSLKKRIGGKIPFDNERLIALSSAVAEFNQKVERYI